MTQIIQVGSISVLACIGSQDCWLALQYGFSHQHSLDIAGSIEETWLWVLVYVSRGWLIVYHPIC